MMAKHKKVIHLQDFPNQTALTNSIFLLLIQEKNSTESVI